MHSDKLGKQRIFTELTTCIVLGAMLFVDHLSINMASRNAI